MTLVCDNKTPVGSRVRIRSNRTIRYRWHYQEGQIASIVGEVYPFAYEVKLDDGNELIFKGDELEDLTDVCPLCKGRGVVESGGAHVCCPRCA